MKRVESVATAIQFSCTGHVAQPIAKSRGQQLPYSISSDWLISIHHETWFRRSKLQPCRADIWVSKWKQHIALADRSRESRNPKIYKMEFVSPISSATFEMDKKEEKTNKNDNKK